MRPVECHVSSLDDRVVIWVTETLNVAMSFCAFGAEVVECLFRVVAVT